MTEERRILLVRHPETEANVDGRFIGRGDASFTERGEAQARLLVDAIVAFGPDAVWTSPLRRTRVVADAAAEQLGSTPVVDARFSELDFGTAEGLTYEQTVESGVTFDFTSEDVPVAPGGESRRDIYERVAEALADIVRPGERVAIVTHGGVFRSAITHLLGLPLSAIWAFHIHNGSIADIRVVDGHGMLEEFRTLG